ncbi:MAG: adenine/guanine/hypoxanthine permease [Verrucomicrobiota bacterium]|jgi:AGZA family xanthine/uracil permease-like MFS transporter|nr:adenine/guanine/hypoxanthine permease [Verrucomicrobiota bacterium]
MLERLFSLKAHQTSVSQEVVAGLTTFAAMAYILAVNPAILSTTGMDKGALITATAIASGVMTAVMALATNYPIALAPGMGLNAFFAFTLCGAKGIPWPAALGLVFYSGLIFLALSVTGLRKKIVEAIPLELKLAITAGIGFFIAFIGLKNGGVVVANPATFVGLGDLSKPGPLLVIAGTIATAILVARKIPGAIILVILALTVVGLIFPAPDGKGMITPIPTGIINLPASLAPTFLKLDLSYFWQNFIGALPIVLAILFVDLFDNMGTLIGVSKRAGLLDKEGNLPKIGRAFMADAGAAMFGSTLGTSTVTSYIESAAGVEAGGRTGLTVMVTAVCFLLALFLAPLILIIPGVATAPALVIVGAFMMQGLAELDLRDFEKTAPAFVTILAMPLAFSISEGVAFGLLTYVGLRIGTGKAKEVGLITYILAFLFILHFLFGR